MNRNCFALLSALVFFFATSAHAQDAASPKFTLLAGAGILTAQGHSRGEFQAGASFDEAPPDAKYGFLFEGGYLGPWADRKSGSAFFSADYMAEWNLGKSGAGHTPKGQVYWRDRGWKFFPFAAAGYTRLFGTGSAVNFGGGFDYRLNHNHAIRVDIRDYYSPSSPAQHNVIIRIGWVAYLPD